MSIQIKTESLFEDVTTARFDSKLEFYLYNSLFGIPIHHAALWDKARNGLLESYITTEGVPQSLKQLTITKFEMTWEQISIDKTPHADLILPREVALKFIQYQFDVDPESASSRLECIQRQSLQSRKWGFQRTAELMASANEHTRKVGSQLLQLFLQCDERFEHSIQEHKYIIHTGNTPLIRIKCTGIPTLNQQETYDIDIVQIILGTYMYGIPIGHINEIYLFTDYQEFIIPSMRVIQPDAFKQAVKLTIRRNSVLSEKYGLQLQSSINKRSSVNKVITINAEQRDPKPASTVQRNKPTNVQNCAKPIRKQWDNKYTQSQERKGNIYTGEQQCYIPELNVSIDAPRIGLQSRAIQTDQQYLYRQRRQMKSRLAILKQPFLQTSRNALSKNTRAYMNDTFAIIRSRNVDQSRGKSEQLYYKDQRRLINARINPME